MAVCSTVYFILGSLLVTAVGTDRQKVKPYSWYHRGSDYVSPDSETTSLSRLGLIPWPGEGIPVPCGISPLKPPVAEEEPAGGGGSYGPSRPRIIKGQESEEGSWPWMALIGNVFPEDDTFVPECTGSLVGPQHVLTAAHCVVHGMTHVQVGERNMDSDDDNPILIPIEKEGFITAIHPGFSDLSIHDDIALLRLSEAVDFLARRDIAPICSPAHNFQGKRLGGLRGTIAGWGATRTGWYSPVLKHAEVNIITRTDCTFLLTKRLLDHKVNLAQIMEVIKNRDDRQVCAGTEGEADICFGDNGGPLMLQNPDGSWSLIGIASFQPSGVCGVRNVPTTYTRVDKYFRWIARNL